MPVFLFCFAAPIERCFDLPFFATTLAITTPTTTNAPTMNPAMITSFECLGSVDEVLDDEATVKEAKCKK